jgi:hypothetical protein
MLKPNPFLHIDAERIYDPLTDRALLPGDGAYERFRAFERSGAADAGLEREGWIVPDGADWSRRHHLKIVSLETATACNQRCYFCPVSIDPREEAVMPDALFERIVGELLSYRSTLESVFLQSYNEPSIERRFVEHCRTLFAAGLPVAVLSNGSGFTPMKTEALIESGPLRYLCINLSTLDEERYRATRGEDHLRIVLRNVDYMKDRPLAEEMKIVVLGAGDDAHQHDFDAIQARYAGSRFAVEAHVVMDRAGWLDVGLKAATHGRPLAGCDNVGSRPLQHLHITPRGTCILCCEDYDEKYVVGDLTTQSIADVLAGDELARMRRWVYGLEEAPADFMCRSCIFARTR